jgi:hypothetical protein
VAGFLAPADAPAVRPGPESAAEPTAVDAGLLDDLVRR